MLELDALREQIETQLGQLLPAKSTIAQPMLDAMRHAVLGGGKRMRPMFACASCDAFGGDLQAALVSGCALEFIHSYSLITMTYRPWTMTTFAMVSLLPTLLWRSQCHSCWRQSAFFGVSGRG